MTGKSGPSFVMFSTAHLVILVIILLIAIILFLSRKNYSLKQQKHQLIERLFAISLLIMELLYYVWMYGTGRWDVGNSLPLELCSISLMLAIILLWTGNKLLYDFVFFAGIGGALQALATPVLDLSFPHFRYFHFFYTHAGIILTALYFTWIKGYRPTFKGIIKAMAMLNGVAAFVFVVNLITEGNYMFLRMKPTTSSLLDYLGAYPWYIISLEVVTFIIFVCLWAMFKRREHHSD